MSNVSKEDLPDQQKTLYDERYEKARKYIQNIEHACNHKTVWEELAEIIKANDKLISAVKTMDKNKTLKKDYDSLERSIAILKRAHNGELNAKFRELESLKAENERLKEDVKSVFSEKEKLKASHFGLGLKYDALQSKIDRAIEYCGYRKEYSEICREILDLLK